jgi:predicted kinase
MTKLVIMMGLPNSGKSTVAAKMDGVVFSGDDYLEKLAREQSKDKELTYNQAFLYCQDHKIDWWGACLKAAAKAMRSGEHDTIIVDGTHMSKKSRRKVMNILKVKEAEVVLVIRDAFPMIHNQRVGKIIRKDVYKRMVGGFCMPTEDESKGKTLKVRTVLIKE